MKTIEENHSLLSVLLAFMVFVLNIIMDKTVGIRYRGMLGYTSPSSWSEIWNNMPAYILGACIFGLFSALLLNQIKKDENKKKQKDEEQKDS
ncbi:MAG: hypothetical protein LBV75_07420 [Paludibacter sp.]|jgi:hypothetical protein|nr:hypothetical protein [Paludibacter sp.]